jgi:hypothetical protein
MEMGTMTALDPAEEILKRIVQLRQQLAFAAQKFEKSAPDGGRSSVHMTLRTFDEFLAAMFGTREPSVFIHLVSCNTRSMTWTAARSSRFWLPKRLGDAPVIRLPRTL